VAIEYSSITLIFINRLRAFRRKKLLNRMICGIMSATLLIGILFLAFNFRPPTTSKISGDVNGSLEYSTPIQAIQTEINSAETMPTMKGMSARALPITETLSLATGILNDYNGSNQRWRDIAENNYTEAYRNAFKYSQPKVTVTYGLLDSSFAGTFNATGFKPNFAYQLKLMGKPTEDPVSDQHLRDIGRSYDIALNQSVGYVIFDYVVTDRNGSAYKEFSLANSYHVLWKVSQRTPQENDSTLTWPRVEGSPSDPPHAYATPVDPTTDVGIYAEWEKTHPSNVPGNVKLPFGTYNVKFIITEESFHSQRETDPIGGYWSTVMGCDVNFTIDYTPTSMKGMTINAWSAEAYNSSDFDQSIANLANIGANWVTFTVFWFMNTSDATKMYRRPDLYTASDSSLIHAIQKAHELNIKIALKPMVDVVDGTWRGQIAPSNWTLWFENYHSFINYYVNLAEANNVELFVVGTELKSSQPYESEWRQVINETRDIFFRNITYAANWDSYRPSSVKFWDALDYVGVDAYFPLTNSYNPTLSQLISAWSYCTKSGFVGRNWTNELYSTYTQTGKEIIFTEIGYCSQDGTNTQPWDWNTSLTVDLQEQADCYQAALEVLKDKEWFEGWFWWNWETDPDAGGPTERHYTPQNKSAQNILKQYYYEVPPDIAVTDVVCSKIVVEKGDSVAINVTLENQGIYTETFNVTTYANTTIIRTQETTLENGSIITIEIAWNTSSLAEGNYIVKAYVWPLPFETDIADNTYVDSVVLVTTLDDIAVIDVFSFKTVVGYGYLMNVNITVENQGYFAETFNVTIYANTTIIVTFTNISLTSRNSITLAFAWNTSGFAKGTYVIWAYAWPVQGETDKTDNTYTDGSVAVTIPGDINGDFKVDIKDLVLAIKHFGSYATHPKWNPNADVNSDGKVDIKDLVLVIKHYGEHYP